MDIETIQSMWEDDSSIDPDNLHEESLKIPSLHAKYYKIYNNIILLKKIEESKYKNLKKDRWLYYTGKADPKVYKETPFDYKVLKSDIDKYMDADEKLSQVCLKIEYYNTMLAYVENILKQILQRNYQIKNAIDFMKFVSGFG